MSNPTIGEWTVHEDGYGILEWHPKHKNGVGMLCRCHDRMEAQYTVDAHNTALAAERKNREDVEKLMIETANAVEKRIAEASIYERDWSQHLRIQLAAEVEKVNKLQERHAFELAAEVEKLYDCRKQLAEYQKVSD